MIGAANLPDETPAWVESAVHLMPALTPPQMFVTIALLTLGVTLAAMILQPLLLLRFFVVLRTRTL